MNTYFDRLSQASLWRPAAASAVALLVGSGVFAVAARDQASPPPPLEHTQSPGTDHSDTLASAKRFWGPFRVIARDVYRYRTLAAQAVDSDLVVAGRIRDLRLDRIHASDHPDGALPIAVATLTVDDSLKGGLQPGTSVEIEFTMIGTPGEARISVGEGASSVPDGQVVAFLRSIDREYLHLKSLGLDLPKPPVAGRYIAINSVGLWASTDRGPVDAPLAGASDAGRLQYLDELRGVGDMQALKERVAQIIGGR